MNLATFLKTLAENGIKISLAEDGKLKVSAPREALTNELQQQLIAYKSELIEWISVNAVVKTDTHENRLRKLPALVSLGKSQLENVSSTADGDNYVALSYAQQRLWFLEQLDGQGKGTYCIPGAMLLEGKVCIEALTNAIEFMVLRHPALRTRFVQQKGQPFQVVLDEYEIDSSHYDFSTLTTKVAEENLSGLLQQEIQQGFDLELGTPFRYRTILLGQEKLVLFLNFHHIIFDGWSNNVFFNELFQSYEALVQGRSYSMDEISIQYTDYSHWQRQWLNSEIKNDLIDYWNVQLRDWQRLEIPTDKPRSPLSQQKGQTFHTQIDPNVRNVLGKLAAREGTTLFNVLLAGFYIFLGKLSSQQDLLIGTDVAGRTATELEKLVGFFVNQIVLRGDISGNPSFKEFLQRVKNMTTDAYAHQDLPFDMLVDALLKERDPSLTPFFSHKFIYQNGHASTGQLFDITLSQMTLPYQYARFDMCWSVVDTGQSLTLAVEFNTELYLPKTIEAFCQQYFYLLAEIASAPDKNISNYSIVDVSLQQKYYPSPSLENNYRHSVASVGLYVENYAAKTPDAIAVVDATGTMSYAQLNVRSNYIASLLQGLGLGLEARIGICLPSSMDYLCAFSAASKIGAVVIPFDMTWPEERINNILSVSCLDAFITLNDILDNLPAYELSFISTLCMDDLGVPQPGMDQFKAVAPLASQLAYIIFTSGTTGEPKGVMVSHSGISALSHEQHDRFCLDGNSKILQFASLGFDASVWEIIMAAGCGGTLYCGNRQDTMPGKALENFINHNSITHLTLPPSALTVMDKASVPSLKYLILAGEACKDEMLGNWHKQVKIFNAYGPTETTICATVEAYRDDCDGFGGSIGKSIYASEVYIVSRDGMLVGPGVVGELVVGGQSVAMGYWSNSGKTAASFIPDSFSGRAGARLYRTGDLAKFAADGSIQFIGRIDHQVKLRGFRIELTEIEQHLLRHPQIKDVAVVLSHISDPAIVAYVVSQGDSLKSEILKDYLRQKVPHYMVPQYIQFIDEIPLTVNGKLNVNALPTPEEEAINPDDVIPQGRYEEMILDVWKQKLKKESISRKINFFDAGGHSLLLMQVQEQLTTEYGIQITVADLFKYPSIQGLANFIEQKNTSQEYAGNPDYFDNISDRASKRRASRSSRKEVETN